MAARLIGGVSRGGGGVVALAAVLAVAASIAASVAACTAFPAASASAVPSSPPPPDAAIAATRTQLDAALRGAGFALIDYQSDYRPPETGAIAAAPRSVYRIVLPDDPEHGVVVVYDLGDPARAAEAGAEYARYLAGGPTRVQFPPDTRFVLRQLGSTLVFYTWSAANSPGPSGARAADVLDTLGQGLPVR